MTLSDINWHSCCFCQYSFCCEDDNVLSCSKLKSMNNGCEFFRAEGDIK